MVEVGQTWQTHDAFDVIPDGAVVIRGTLFTATREPASALTVHLSTIKYNSPHFLIAPLHLWFSTGIPSSMTQMFISFLSEAAERFRARGGTPSQGRIEEIFRTATIYHCGSTLHIPIFKYLGFWPLCLLRGPF